MQDRYQKLADAVEIERQHEEQYFRELSHAKSFKERIEAGILWYPVSIDKMHYSIAEKIELEVSPAKMSASSHKRNFRVGASAVFFTNDEERRDIKGTISYVHRDRIRIILGDDYHIKDVQHVHNAGLELVHDDRPYRVMKESLEAISSVSQGSVAELRDALIKGEVHQSLTYFTLGHIEAAHLNPSQLAAVQGCMRLERVGVIHGPPGTGKTTTIVALAQALTRAGEKILMAAPSNNAVDLLAKRLSDHSVSVLRVGNVSRIGDHIAHLALDEKVRMHRDWQHIKQVKIEAEAAKREAAKYKRKFGPQQKQDRRAFQQEARSLRKWARELEDKLVEQILGEAQVICTTLIGCAHQIMEDFSFDTVIIDEGSQAVEPEAWTAILRANKVIIAGDHQQLPPTVKSSKASVLDLDVTLLDHLTDMPGVPTFLLDTQYRMNQTILGFSNQEFYKGELKSADFVAQRRIGEDTDIVTMIDTSGCGFDERRNEQHRSVANEGEYFLIREHLLAHQEMYSQQPTSIGVISPYARQVGYIRDQLRQDAQFDDLDIMVNSIDGFQGQEKDVIYLSLVRSNDRGEIGFLKDYRRLNVALTRARYKLIIIGDMSTLGHDKMYQKLADYVEEHGVYKSGWEYMSV